jgi:hypothetical protein
MGEDIALTRPDRLRLYEPGRFSQFDHQPQPANTPNEWFVQRYPDAYENHGSPFLELVEPLDQFTVQVLPITINHDFFASALGGRRDLGQHVIYFEPELAWYFRDSDGIFKSTSAEKLMNVYRALMMKCAQDMPANVHKLNLVHEWRSDRTAKAIIQRARSILAADHSFFSPTSKYQRIRGPELFERLIRVLCETMLEKREGACLTVTQAYQAFCKLSEQRQLGQLKRSHFKELMRDLVRNEFGLGLRRDVPDAENKQQEAWKGLKLIEARVGLA